MKLGLGFAPTGAYGIDEWMKAAIYADQTGFDSVWLTEDYYSYDAISILGVLSSTTRNIRIATGIINPYTRNLALIGMTMVTLDQVSKGRAILGLGSGCSIVSFSTKRDDAYRWKGRVTRYKEQMGIDTGVPLKDIQDALIILRRLLAGEKVTQRGDTFELSAVQLRERCIQKRLPIYLGQMGPRMLKMAGRLADGVLLTTGSSPEYVKWSKAKVDEGRRVAGRKSSAVRVACRILFAATESKNVHAVAKRYLSYLLSTPSFGNVLEATGYDQDSVASIKEARLKGDEEGMIRGVTDDMVKNFTIVGTGRFCRDRLRQYQEAGVDVAALVPILPQPLEAVKAAQSFSE